MLPWVSLLSYFDSGSLLAQLIVLGYQCRVGLSFAARPRGKAHEEQILDCHDRLLCVWRFEYAHRERGSLKGFRLASTAGTSLLRCRQSQRFNLDRKTHCDPLNYKIDILVSHLTLFMSQYEPQENGDSSKHRKCDTSNHEHYQIRL
jgi:hypothetical protein